MRALSIRQPWAWLITRPDVTDAAQAARITNSGERKTIENRSWRTSYRGHVLLHAGKVMARKYHFEVSTWAREAMGIQVPAGSSLQLGGIVGVARIADCIDASSSPWFSQVDGNHGLVLADVQPLPFWPCAGALSFFHVPVDELPEGTRQLLADAGVALP